MPRLCNYDYIKRHILLSKVWDPAFTQLDHRDQLDLHSYYCPTLALTNDELITYRQGVSRQNPSLPSRAGKAFAILLAYLDNPMDILPPASQGNGLKSSCRSPIQQLI